VATAGAADVRWRTDACPGALHARASPFPPSPPALPSPKEISVLHDAVVFLVIALIAALFGFGGIASGAMGLAKILFVVFIALAVISFVVGLIRRG
jgi:uncharacterized membrane protein YtjA (UPF0391 family)